ncbi:ABC transporter permease subunit [Dactylosporangium darangshiense]|uniref:ABC transmembrane type-1 domain-containing protein n=1 Tax=Dactylosporangium darangshiense TaxID=579108 RepID=A0ABP8DD56_9ACTN
MFAARAVAIASALPLLGVFLAGPILWSVYSAFTDVALSGLPSDLHEVAQIDGASLWQRLRYVTLPLIRRSIVSNLMLLTLQTLASFELTDSVPALILFMAASSLPFGIWTMKNCMDAVPVEFETPRGPTAPAGRSRCAGSCCRP